MHLKTRIALLAAVAVTALAGAGAVYACDGSHHDTNGVAGATFTMERHHHGYGLLHASATYLGLTAEQLKTKLKAGQTLGQVADATSGKSASGLVDYLTGLVTTRLDRLVAAHRITSTQESAILDRVHTKLAKLVDLKLGERSRMDWHH
jgi:hypothetical protein